MAVSCQTELAAAQAASELYTVYLDCAVTQRTTSPTTDVSINNNCDLSHLEGEAVTVLADGVVVNGLTVSSGAITLPQAASVVHVGLAYTSDLETMSLDVGSEGDGTSQGKKKKVSRLTVRLHNSRGLWAGPDENNLVEMKWRSGEDYDTATDMFSGDKVIVLPPKYAGDGRLMIRQIDPLPVTVLGIMPEVDTDGTK